MGISISLQAEFTCFGRVKFPSFANLSWKVVSVMLLRLNGEILSKDIVIASVRDGLITEANRALLPLFLKRTGDVESWLRGRAIDSHRTNSRLLKKALRLSSADDVTVVMHVKAATITDSYWFRIEGSSMCYEDVRFKANYFDTLALRGDPDSFNQPYSPTPELTNIGSFEKCWRLIDDKWWMFKQGNDLERFSELFASKLGQALGFPMAECFPEDGVIKSLDFTDGASVNYEAADGIVGEDEDYFVNFEAFWQLSPKLAEQYLQIIYLDTLCFNMDRHTKNYGVLRDVETGEILRMAPNFDNNIALFSRGVPKDLSRRNDKLVSLFCELLSPEANNKSIVLASGEDNTSMLLSQYALDIIRRFSIPSFDIVNSCLDQIDMAIDRGTVCAFIMNGSNQIQDCIKKQH